MRCIAAPILTPNGDVAGALSVSGPSRRLQGERFREEIPEMLQSSANVIELNLTHS